MIFPKKLWKCCFGILLPKLFWPTVRKNCFKPCPFGLRKRLDPVVVIFFKNAEKNTWGGLILFLEKFGLILGSELTWSYTLTFYYMNIFCKKLKYRIKPNFSKDRIRPPHVFFSAFLKKITTTGSSHFLSPMQMDRA